MYLGILLDFIYDNTILGSLFMDWTSEKTSNTVLMRLLKSLIFIHLHSKNIWFFGIPSRTTRPNVGATFGRMRNLSVFCGGTENRRHYLSCLCSKNIKHWKWIVNRHEKMCSKQWAQIRTRHVFIFNIEKNYLKKKNLAKEE